MGHLSLITINPAIKLVEHRFSARGWQTSFDIRMPHRWVQELKLSSGEAFEDLESKLNIVADTTEAFEGFAKGSLSYWKPHQSKLDWEATPAALIVTIRLPQVDIDRLNESILSGFPLSGLNVEAEGLKYGWAPDGSMKEWDNVATPVLEIVGYTLHFGQPENENDAAPRAESQEEVRMWQQGQIAELGQKVTQLASRQSTTNILLILLFVLGCIIAGK